MNITSSCPNKEICGSCRWSHIPYQKQLDQKLSDINSSFRSHALTLSCEEIVPAPQIAHYRNRMDFAIDYQGRVGLREKGKWWRVLDNHCCFISDIHIESAFHTVRQWTQKANLSFFDRKAHTGLLRYAVIRCTKNGETLITIITSAPTEESEEQRVKDALAELAAMLPTQHVVWSIADTVSDVSRGDRIIPIQNTPYLTEQILDYQYQIHPFTFFQTNSLGAEKLLGTVLEFSSSISGKRFVDLYCGSGFFTIPISAHYENTLGIEIEEEAIERARSNAALNNISIDFLAAKTEDSSWAEEPIDLLLVDPPRAGLHDRALEQLKKAHPPTLIYVSCNYKALARELQILHGHYEVENIRAIDMFPHTPHVEVVTLLRAKKA